MRSIKFRAWASNDNRMWWLDDPAPAYKGSWSLNDLKEAPAWEVMQFTGLLDKNGKEIWEGDILQHSLWKIPVKVYWEHGGFMAQSVTGELGKGSYTDGTLYDMQLPKCKVIGDVYTTPELLKGEL